MAAAVAGVSVSGGGNGCGGGLVEPENGGATASAANLPGADRVAVAASVLAGTGGDVEGELVDGDGDGGGVEAIGDGLGAGEASGDPENGGVTAVICDESAEGAFASVTICSGGWSGAAGSPWNAITSSEYLLPARSETNPSVSS